MKKIFITFAVFVSIIWTGGTSFGQDVPAPLDYGPREALSVVSADGEFSFDVEIADTASERTRGLMFRDLIEPTHGMLFEFDGEQISSIWMKNTSIFLDVIFVRADGRILKIEHSAKPYSLRSMTSGAPVSAVLEIAGGRAMELGIKPGDVVKHPFFANGS